MFNSNNQNGTALVENNSFILPTPMDDSVSATDLSEDMEGLRLTFPKVKIPGGGVLQFEMASDNPDRPDYIPELEGISAIPDLYAFGRERQQPPGGGLSAGRRYQGIRQRLGQSLPAQKYRPLSGWRKDPLGVVCILNSDNR